MLEELYFLKEINYGMLQLEKRVDYPVYFYEHQLRKALILDEAVNITIKYKKIVGQTMTTEEQLIKPNLGNKEKPKEVLINVILL